MFKTILVALVVLATLIIGAGSASAGWSWNSQIQVEGNVISTAWTVTSSQNFTEITLEVPNGVNVSVLEVASEFENVTVVHNNQLRWTDNGIEAKVTYYIQGTTTDIDVSVAQVVNGYRSTEIASVTNGVVGERISVDLLLPNYCFIKG